MANNRAFEDVKNKAGEIEFKKEEVSLMDCINSALISLEPLLADKEVKVLGNKNAKSKGDKEWTTEAVINILKNAKEYGNGSIYPIYLKGFNMSKLVVESQNGIISVISKNGGGSEFRISFLE